MPPCAAFECERTGWTLLMIPTETPSSAAASAARWPASPAPISKYIVVRHARLILYRALVRPDGRMKAAGGGAGGRSARPTASTVMTPLRRPSPSIATSAPSRRSASFPSTVSRGASSGHRQGALVSGEDLAHGLGRPLGGIHAIDGAMVEQPDEARGAVDHREPAVAVAQEEFVQGPLDRARPRGSRPARGPSRPRTESPSRWPWTRLWVIAPAGALLVQDEADDREPEAAESGRLGGGTRNPPRAISR